MRKLLLVPILLVALILASCSSGPNDEEIQRAKIADSDAKAGARSAQTALENLAAQRGGQYTGVNAAELNIIEPTLSGYDLSVDQANTDSYSLTVTSDSGNTFSASRTPAGELSYTCTTAIEGAGCPENGNWGGS